ncbi:MAG TPA: RNA polymerase sigma factor [Bacteroidales bacterium]|nr:RNA polymerase sigma factor [Bacteroidales bacterium]
MDDLVLINDSIAGDEKAFRAFAEKYAGLIFRVIRSFGISREDAEDLSQDVFIDIYKNIRKFRKEAEVSTWLYRIAINRSINYVNKSKRSKWMKRNQGDLKDYDNRVFDESSEMKFMDNEQKRILYYTIDKLPENQKIAFTLNKIDELSYKEIADIMNISVSSVESLIHRAKQNLQKRLLNFFE